jgi:hypothetical protein
MSRNKSFLIFLALAAFLTVVAFILMSDLRLTNDMGGGQEQSNSPGSIDRTAIKHILPEISAIDTADWKTYNSDKYGFSFRYRPEWKVLAPVQKGEFVVLQVDPGAKYYNFKIFVSPNQYYIMDGLPAKEEMIGGVKAINVNNSLYGLRSANSHLTFDVSWSMQLLSDFNAMVHSFRPSLAN